MNVELEPGAMTRLPIFQIVKLLREYGLDVENDGMTLRIKVNPDAPAPTFTSKVIEGLTGVSKKESE